ncbi:DNA mismatch repair endonuclease MutL [Alphaproteobacteria bacterium]|jgi:DNA mismatch repair protein MutL|nr:DNA mismatch repair endonuclease MutL [Alphaproteobacteria bacterium]MDA9807063.1 DNA mismatch repair endonuclease MutL [Alphaproteobacteria bacterium]
MEIRRLPENLINQIAAGEVVERPASALKELIENSIDANATQIDIVLDDGGKSLISVSDNGIGIEKNHIGLAVERHATSKLPTNNLNKINFLGFRGEALPSIAAVSQLNIQTKSKNSNDAWALDVAAGNFDEIYPSSRQIGTIISVKNLFYATPARLKFLKSSNLERSYCHQIVLKQALVNPLIGFRLQADGRELLNIKPENERDTNKSFLNRIRNILGKNFADEAIKIKNSKAIKNQGFAKINGFIGLPTLNKSNYSQQYLFINGRSIQDRNLSGAIRAAYRDTLPKGRFPVFCLYIEVPPEFIDVNVHPGKTEVRFEDNAIIRSLLVGSISRELNISFSQTTSEISKQAVEKFNTYNQIKLKDNFGNNENFFSNNDLEPSIKTIKETDNFEEQQVIDQNDDFPLGVALAQFSKNYIISRNSEGIVIVDQHAAHERLVLEKMKAARENKSLEKQILLLPEVINLAPTPLEMILENVELLSDIGFIIEPFGEGMIIVREVPALIGDADIKQIIIDLGDDLSSTGLPTSYHAKIDLILGNIACHRSVRSGRSLNENEMNQLLREMERTPNSGQCNHGRPTSISLSLKDIEKLFNRT